jgi:hypothetical protein
VTEVAWVSTCRSPRRTGLRGTIGHSAYSRVARRCDIPRMNARLDRLNIGRIAHIVVARPVGGPFELDQICAHFGTWSASYTVIEAPT